MTVCRLPRPAVVFVLRGHVNGSAASVLHDTGAEAAVVNREFLKRVGVQVQALQRRLQIYC